jgi:hypothetical protein
MLCCAVLCQVAIYTRISAHSYGAKGLLPADGDLSGEAKELIHALLHPDVKRARRTHARRIGRTRRCVASPHRALGARYTRQCRYRSTSASA